MAKEEGQMPGAKKILLSQNDAATLRLLSGALASPHWQLEIAQGTADALRLVKQQPYDLVVTSIQSEGADDVDLLRRMRRVRPHLKLIVLTAGSTPNAVIDSLREHAFSYFSQPISSRGVAEMVNEALDSPGWDDGIEVLSALPKWVTLRVQCRTLTADRLLQFLREMATDLPSQEIDNIATAFREILMNAMEHGAGLDPSKRIYVSYVRTSQMIIYYVRDPGEGFSFNTLPQAAISNPPDNPGHHLAWRVEHGMRPGGFGMLFARELVDELIYNEKGNEVLLVKYLAGDRPGESSQESNEEGMGTVAVVARHGAIPSANTSQALSRTHK
jgi:two-component system, OmpR family, response regulator